jgi:hypothetical protein
MSKNLNGITMQIDAILIVYLLLQCLRHGYAYRNSPHIWEQVEIYTNCHPAGVQLCPAAGRSLPGNVKFCCKIQHL